MNLMNAHKQWATRPADQRFRTLGELLLATNRHMQESTFQNITPRELSVDVSGEDEDGLILRTARNPEIDFNYHSFGQFCTKLGLPPSTFREIRPVHAVPIFMDRLRNLSSMDESTLFMRQTADGVQLMAFTSDDYGRIYNYEVVEALVNIGGNWRPPPARPANKGNPAAYIATEADCVGNTRVQPGDLCEPAGLYASEADMFAFLTDCNKRINDGSDGGLCRGFFVQNSEVGRSRFRLMSFWFREVCGNHIVWGAENIVDFSIRHFGRQARIKAFKELNTRISTYANSSSIADEQRIVRARHLELAPNKEKMIDFVFTDKALLSKKDAEKAWDRAEMYQDIDGAPTTAWGYSQGITRVSQDSQYAEDRDALDKVAGKILAFANN